MVLDESKTGEDEIAPLCECVSDLEASELDLGMSESSASRDYLRIGPTEDTRTDRGVS